VTAAGKMFFFAAALCCLASPAGAQEVPLDVVRNSNQAILDIYAGQEKIDQAAEDEIFRIIDSVTDFGIMADADRFCPKLSAEECREFKDVFIELLRTSSVKKLGRYRADSFDYVGERKDGEEAVVDTVAHFENERLSLVYYLALSEEQWRIVNYVVDDVDTIRNYRKQFKRLFAKRSYAEVVQRLRDRIASYGQGAAQ
jgi:ABC-type transporter MlaC component